MNFLKVPVHRSESLIVLRLAGGLGNQLFQVMAALLLCKLTGQHIAVLTQGLKNYRTNRSPGVIRLLSSPFILKDNIPALPRLTRWAVNNMRLGRWLPIIGLNDSNFPHAVEDSHRAFHTNILDGYFQRGWTDALLSNALDLISVNEFDKNSLRTPEYDCLVHIRGGDFLFSDSHAFLGVDYYDSCLFLARESGCKTFGIVTDDPIHAGQIISKLKLRHSQITFDVLPKALDILEDFTRLRHARTRIIGNSTFAWWAAALDEEAGTTWSPDRFVRSHRRDFFLSHERTVPSTLL